MRLCGLLCVALLGTAVVGCAGESQRAAYYRQPASEMLFTPQPAMPCQSSVPVKELLKHPRPGTIIGYVVGQESNWLQTRMETLDLPLAKVPALTVAAELNATGDSVGNEIDVVGGSGSAWGLHLCAKGSDKSKAQATRYAQDISMHRNGGLVTLSGPVVRGYSQAMGMLRVDDPEAAPVTIMDASGAVRVRDVSGPVWVSTARGRATILNTTGNVDASGFIVDYAGSRGAVRLNGDEIDVKLTGKQFDGDLQATGEHPVRVLLPVGFETPIRVTVKGRKDFVCRAKLCSSMQRSEKNGWYMYSYAGEGGKTAGQVRLVSNEATVVIDNWK